MRKASFKLSGAPLRAAALVCAGLVLGMLLTSVALIHTRAGAGLALSTVMETLTPGSALTVVDDDDAAPVPPVPPPKPVAVQPAHASLPPPVVTVAVDSARADDHLHPRVLYVVRTAPKFYDSRLVDVLETYLAEVRERLILLVGNTAHVVRAPDHTAGMHSTDMRELRVMATDGSDGYDGAKCADNHEEGVTCIEGRALFYAYERMNDFDWLFMVDDDVYVHRHNVEMTVGKLDPKVPLVYTFPGCGEKVKCATDSGGGICGGGGYFLSRQSLERAVCGEGMGGANASAALCSSKGKGTRDAHRVEWMTSWMGVGELVAKQDGSWWSDITAGCALYLRGGIRTHPMAGLHPWEIKATELIGKLANEAPLSFHYVHYEEMPGMKGMHKLVTGTNRNSTANKDKFGDNVVPRPWSEVSSGVDELHDHQTRMRY